MTTHRAFLTQLLEACKDFHWSCRLKQLGPDQGFIVSPPVGKRRPGHETVFIWQPRNHHERKVLAQRCKAAGLPITIVESEVHVEDDNKMAQPPKPSGLTIIDPTASLTSPRSARGELAEGTLDRIRRKINAIADLCAEVVVDLDALAKERSDIDQLKLLLKNIGQ